MMKPALAAAAAAAAMLLLSACGGPPKGPDVLQVFSAVPSERSGSLTRPGDAALWDELGLSRVQVTAGKTVSRTVGGREWLTVSAALDGGETELYLRRDSAGEWQLDLRASFGVNSIPLSEWENEDDILTVRVTAALADELPGPYRGMEATHAAAVLRDYTGEGTVTAAFPKTSSDGEALSALLADGQEHRVLLRLRRIPEEFWQEAEAEEAAGPVWRVTQYAAPGWFDEAAVLREQNPELLQAVRQGRTERVQELLTPDNVQLTDENGDSLLYLALSDHMTEIAKLLIQNGCSGRDDNIYWHDMQHLLGFEREDILALAGRLRQTGGSPGCTAESLAHCLVERSNSAGLELYLSAYSPQYELSGAESRALAGRYGLPAEAAEANLLDVAVLDGNPQTAELLLADGIRASELLKEKLRLQPTSFSEQLLAVLGRQNYFGVLDGVLRDYAVFRESYLREAADAVKRFHKYYNRYLDAEVAGDVAEARAVMDSKLLSAIAKQLEAVQKVERPESEAIGELWDLMFQYADMMDTAGYYYKRTSYSTYIVTRRWSYSSFENRLERGEALRIRFLTEFETYERLYQNTL